MREVGVLEAKTNLSALIHEVEQGADGIVITRNGKRVARLVALANDPPIVRNLSGSELAERFRLLRESISRNRPQSDALTFEKLKDMMHE